MKIVCIGDSLTSGYKMPKSRMWPELVSKKYSYEVLNMGIAGDTTGGMLSRFHRDVVKQHPVSTIIMGGVNDLIWGVPLSILESNIAALVEHSYHYNIIPIIGIPVPIEIEGAAKYWPFIDDFSGVNQNISEYRQWILKFAINFKCQAIDFYKEFIDDDLLVIKSYYSDGLHPTLEGNKIMADIVKF